MQVTCSRVGVEGVPCGADHRPFLAQGPRWRKPHSLQLVGPVRLSRDRAISSCCSAQGHLSQQHGLRNSRERGGSKYRYPKHAACPGACMRVHTYRDTEAPAHIHTRAHRSLASWNSSQDPVATPAPATRTLALPGPLPQLQGKGCTTQQVGK